MNRGREHRRMHARAAAAGAPPRLGGAFCRVFWLFLHGCRW
jgi:hypothetical protein